MMSRVLAALAMAAVLSGAAAAAPMISNKTQCDRELANVTAMRGDAPVGAKIRAEIDGMLSAGGEHCARGAYPDAERVFAVLRGMMATE